MTTPHPLVVGTAGHIDHGKTALVYALTGVDAAWRGHGHGRMMIAALLDTPPGRKAYVVRVKTYGQESAAMAHLLQSFGYACVHETPQHTWYLRNDAPEGLRTEWRGKPMPSTAN